MDSGRIWIGAFFILCGIAMIVTYAVVTAERNRVDRESKSNKTATTPISICEKPIRSFVFHSSVKIVDLTRYERTSVGNYAIYVLAITFLSLVLNRASIRRSGPPSIRP